MNEQKQPEDPPREGGTANPDPNARAPHGVPDGIEDNEAKGLPHSDRQKTEQAVKET